MFFAESPDGIRKEKSRKDVYAIMSAGKEQCNYNNNETGEDKPFITFVLNQQ